MVGKAPTENRHVTEIQTLRHGFSANVSQRKHRDPTMKLDGLSLVLRTMFELTEQ